MIGYTSILIASAGLSFFIHDFLDKNYIGKHKRDVKLVVWGVHFHHSFFGALVIALALVFSFGTFATVVCCGYGVGNIWQHKITHNREKEKGMVFITRVYPNKRAIS